MAYSQNAGSLPSHPARWPGGPAHMVGPVPAIGLGPAIWPTNPAKWPVGPAKWPVSPAKWRGRLTKWPGGPAKWQDPAIWFDEIVKVYFCLLIVSVWCICRFRWKKIP